LPLAGVAVAARGSVPFAAVGVALAFSFGVVALKFRSP